jgi:L-threonylcarbamoyladenylate synthase
MTNTVTSIAKATQILKDGKLLFYPTETFYALGCEALNAEAVRKVYAAKQRKPELPLPVIIGEEAQLALLTGEPGTLTRQLMRCFWPGPLTILFRSADKVPELLTAGTGKVAVRLSSHPAARALCLQCATALVSTSANISGRAAVNLAEDISTDILTRVRELNHGAPCLYEAEEDAQPGGGLPSTIVEVREAEDSGILRVLRQGAVSLDELKSKIPAGLEISI